MLKDEIYLAAALGAAAEYIVSYDEDLLALGNHSASRPSGQRNFCAD